MAESAKNCEDQKINEQIGPVRCRLYGIQMGLQEYQIFKVLVPESIRPQFANFYNPEISKVKLLAQMNRTYIQW